MKNNQGSIIVMCLVITTAVLILLGVFLGSVVAERRNVERSFRRAQAIHVAEAGVERGIWEITQATSPFTGWTVVGSIKTITLGSANFDNVGECTVMVSGPLNYVISATGYAPSISSSHRADRAVRVTLASVSDSPFKYALFADEGPLKMLGWSSTDSYDSRDGPHGGGNKGYEGNIGTNSTVDDSIIIKPGAMVEGNVIVGPGGDPTDVIFNQGTISGDTVANTAEETARLLTNRLHGMTVSEIKKSFGKHIKGIRGGDRNLFDVILNKWERIFSMFEINDIHVAGLSRLLSHPDFTRSEDSLRLVDLFENKYEIADALKHTMMSEENASINIGDNSLLGSNPPLSLVSALYHSSSTSGVVAVIGPTRIYYPKLLAIVKYTASITSRFFTS